MKKSNKVLTLLALTSIMAACGNPGSSSEDTSTSTTESSSQSSSEPEKKRLKILSIGNSFGEDTIKYVPAIAEGLGIETTVAHMFIPGCSMALHRQNCDTDAASYRYYKNYGEGWMEKEHVAISTAVAEEDWDYIMFNGLSGETDLEDGYNDYLLKYVGVRASNPKVKLGFNMTFTYNQDNPPTEGFNVWFFNNYKRYNFDGVTMYNASSSAFKTYQETSKLCDFVLPVATAVQNAKAVLGDALIHRDYIHMSHFVGRYLCGLTYVYFFTGESGTSFRPSFVTKEQADVLEQAAKDAIKSPWTITNPIKG